jgi:hypothetical protein
MGEMNMRKDVGRLAAAVCVVAACGAAVVQPAQAQWNVTGVGVVEYDTEQTLLVLAGLSAGPGGLGLSPVIGVMGYYLRFDVGDRSVNVWTVRPNAGLRYGFQGGAWQARVGYAFTSRDEGVPDLVIQDAAGGDGVVVSTALDWWGTGGPLGAQLLGAYNFGSESLWTRGRLTTRVTQPAAGGGMHVGGEVALLHSPGFTAWQPGAVINWHTPGGTILGLGVGLKISEDAPNATYFRGEVVLPIVRR